MKFVSFTVETLSPYKAISCENLEEAQAVYAECEEQGMNPVIYGITEHGNDYMLSAPKKSSESEQNRYYSILRPVMPGGYPKPEGNKMRFEINILLSKKEYLALCEEAGVGKDEFWKNIPPVCFRKDQNGSCPGAYHYSYGNGKRLMSKCEKCKYKA